MKWFKRNPKCEHDWHDTGIRDWEWSDGWVAMKIQYATTYCPKCRNWQTVSVDKWSRINACQRIQAVYKR